MVFEFYFENTYYLPVYEVSVIGRFNHYDPKANILKRHKDGYHGTAMFSPGEYEYKFLINGVLRLNDPAAQYYRKDKNGEVWTVLVIDKNGNRLSSETEQRIELYNHVICGQMVENMEACYSRECFTHADERVCAGYGFGNILGTHSITAIWVNPDLAMHHICEHVIEVLPGDMNNATDVWFWLDFHEKRRYYPKGVWRIKLYINGNFIMEDKFHFESGYLYSVNNRSAQIRYIL